MGQVYKAEDTRLKRSVALKFLAPNQLRDEELKARFLHEAQAAASLDHPNICGVYEIDQVGDRLFMAMPFLEGEGLDKLIERGPLPIPDLLEISIQVGEALQEAHSRGVVHRDIKPANVMVRQKGSRLHSVLMDFGVARLSQSTRLTLAGSQLGTAAYMSPEQIEGAAVDGRTDIWSLGVLLYEMTAGLLPFPSEYEQAQFYAILNEAPEPLSSVRTGVPQELERIVDKCMAKAVDDRYQTCTDLIVDLRGLQRAYSTRTPSHTKSIGTSGPAVSTQVARPARQPLVIGRVVVALVAVGLLSGVGTWLAKPSAPALSWVPEYEFLRLTWDAGLSFAAAISRDGRLVAYSSDRDGGGRLDIWVEQANGGGRVQVTNSDIEDTDPVFSPDGSTLAFTRGRDIYLAPALGGNARFLVAGGSFPSFSPDGKTISYATHDGRLMLVDLDGSEPRTLQSGFDWVVNSLWLPNGRDILFSGLQPPEGTDLWVSRVSGGEPVRTNLAGFLRSRIGLNDVTIAPKWFEPGQSIVFGSASGLWKADFSTDPWGFTGHPEPLGFGPSNFHYASVAEDGTIALSQIDTDDVIWSEPVGSPPDVLRGSNLRSPTEPAALSLSRSARRLAFVGRTGSTDVYIRDLPTGEETNITNNEAHERGAVISADGRFVAYESRSDDGSEIRIYATELGQSRRLCGDCGIPNSWSPRNEYLLVSDGDPSVIWRVSVADGSRSELISSGDGKSVTSARYSPDGRWIAFAERDGSNRNSQVFVAPSNPGAAISQSDWIRITGEEQDDAMPRWSPEGQSLYFLSDRAGNRDIWSVALNPDRSPRADPSAVKLFETTRFSLVTQTYQEIGYAIGTDRIYFTMRELKGRIYLMRPTAAVANLSP